MRKIFVTLLVGLLCQPVWADTFKVADIKLEGLQRISAGTVFGAFPIGVGDQINERKLAQATRALFKTGYFDDIVLQRTGNTLIVNLVELPTISSLDIEGNKAIETEALLQGLEQAGLAEGLVFKRSTMERIELELERQYVAQGRYDASIDTEVKSLPRNRVKLTVNVDEGSVASISRINVVGNESFTKEDLLEQFELKESSFWSWYTSDDKYSREKLSGDLERLNSYYLDRGYIRFNVDSTQVALSPTKEDVFITANVTEGDVYSVGEIKLAGELILEEEELRRLVLIKTGDTFSRRMMTTTSDLMSKRLGNEGFTFAEINGMPDIDDENKSVDITFFVTPGKRTYVRRINITGNSATKDEVIRREMRQMEGGWASTELIEQSKVRLEQLGFFKEVNVETPLVPGTDDMIDANFTVEEQPSGSLNLNVGFSNAAGLVVGSSVSQNNFLGTGNRVSTSVSKNRAVSSVNFSYFNPYYTVDGISRGYNFFYSETDYGQFQSLIPYSANRYGAGVNFGFPITNRQRFSFNTELSKTIMDISDTTATPEMIEFKDENGEDFLELTVGPRWSWSTLNRGLFPTAGVSQSVNLDLTVPGSELEYYKLTYKGNYYFPFNDDWVVRLRTDIGVGEGYGDTRQLPFYKNFYAGGVGSVRGFRANSLGPQGVVFRSIACTSADPECENLNADGDGSKSVPFPRGRSLGGNLLTEFSLELIFPTPFVDDQRSVRTALFLDAGNVFDTSCSDLNPYCLEGFDKDELRVSLGASATWITGIGPLTFTFATPLNSKDSYTDENGVTIPGDEVEGFEFSLGQTF